MPAMDVFESNAFSMRTLTAALLNRPHAPMRLGRMGLFQSAGIRTTKASIERKGNTLALVQTTARGAPAPQKSKNLRDMIDIPTVRIAKDDTITADEVQDVREFGSESNLQSLQSEVNERSDNLEIDIEVTEEWQRIGALKGIVLDADASVLLNLFDTFDVTAQAEVGLDVASVPNGQLRATIAQAIVRPIRDELGGLPWTGIHVMASSELMDALHSHNDVQDHLKHYPQGSTKLTEGIVENILDFGGVVWEEYRGSVGGQDYVSANKGHAFPLGVPNLFISRYAPAEYWDTVNTRGLPRYVKMNPDGTDSDHSRTVRVQSNPIHLCTRPRTLIPLRVGA